MCSGRRPAATNSGQTIEAMAFDGIFLGAHQRQATGSKLRLDALNPLAEGIGFATDPIIHRAILAVSIGIGRPATQLLAKKEIAYALLFQHLFKDRRVEVRKPSAQRLATNVNHKLDTVRVQQPGIVFRFHGRMPDGEQGALRHARGETFVFIALRHVFTFI